MVDKERIAAAHESAAEAEWRFSDSDVIRYELASRRWFGSVEPFNDHTGAFGRSQDLSQVQIEMLRRFFDFVLRDGRRPSGHWAPMMRGAEHQAVLTTFTKTGAVPTITRG